MEAEAITTRRDRLRILLGAVFTLATDLIVGTAPPEQAGAASALAETSSELGGALGIAILGSVVTAIYRSVMAAPLPAGVPGEAATAARDTLGGAFAAVRELPAETGAVLLSAARAAFADAFGVTAVICAAVALAAALLTAIVLRSVGSSDAQEQPSAPKPDDTGAGKAEWALAGAVHAPSP